VIGTTRTVRLSDRTEGRGARYPEQRLSTRRWRMGSVEIEQAGLYGTAAGTFGCQRLCDSGDSNAPEPPITATRTAQFNEPGISGPETTQACWVIPR
jgi:hypothetical protein